MKTAVSKKVKKIWFEEISLPTTRIRNKGGCATITIPKYIMEREEGLKIGKFVHPILIVRKRKYKSESKSNEEWVLMNSEERVQFELYLAKRRQN